MTRVAFSNLGNGPDAAVTTILDQLHAAGAQLIGLAEASDRQHVIAAWCKAHGWRSYGGDGTPGADAVPILWSPKVRVVARGTREAVPSRYVGDGAGPDTAKRKVVNWVRLDTGLVLLGTHMVASATRAGHEYDLRREHYRQHVRVLADMVRRRQQHGRDVVVVGDFNAEPDFALLAPLYMTGLVQWVKQPTLDGRTVDHLWSARKVTGVRVLDVPSDHRAVIGDVP